MPKLKSGFGSDPKASQMKCLATSLTILILANTGCTQNQYAAAKQDCANSGGQFIAYGSRGYGCFINDVSGQPTKAQNILHQKQDFLKPRLPTYLMLKQGILQKLCFLQIHHDPIFRIRILTQRRILSQTTQEP